MSVSLSEPNGPRLHVNVVDMACAIREAGNGVEQSGAYDVADLKAGVIVAVPEGRQFGELLVGRISESKFLGEDRVGDVLALASAVGDADTRIAALPEVMVEAGRLGTATAAHRRRH